MHSAANATSVMASAGVPTVASVEDKASANEILIKQLAAKARNGSEGLSLPLAASDLGSQAFAGTFLV